MTVIAEPTTAKTGCPVCGSTARHGLLTKDCRNRASRSTARLTEAEQDLAVRSSTASPLGLMAYTEHPAVALAIVRNHPTKATLGMLADRLHYSGCYGQPVTTIEWHEVVLAALRAGSEDVAKLTKHLTPPRRKATSPLTLSRAEIVDAIINGTAAVSATLIQRHAATLRPTELRRIAASGNRPATGAILGSDTMRARMGEAATRSAVSRMIREDPFQAYLLVRFHGPTLTPAQRQAGVRSKDLRLAIYCARAARTTTAQRLRLQRRLVADVEANGDDSAAWDALETAVEARIDGPTEFEGRYGTSELEWTHAVVDGQPVLCGHVEGWHAYGRSPARYRAATYVGGFDDSGVWVVRVTSSATTVHAALAALVPAEVAKARGAGKRVVRQGDVYGVETTKAHDAASGSVAWTRHVWDADARTLTHPEHATVRIPFPVRFVRQSVLPMRGTGRTAGD